ncbi:MAG: SemiSWEET transporter [Gammaproteobacteria bacterium]|nr:SemiSWEET transporter [Gammaproteobacteria bacterium]
MDTLNTLGLVAGSLTTLAFVPQVVKIWRTRSADDISTVMFLLFSTGVLLWLLYGIVLNALPVIVANGVTLVLAVMVLVLKFRFRR